VKLLFITSNRMGDAILSTGLLDHLTASGGVETTLVCGPVAERLFAELPGLERLIVLRKEPRGGHWRKLWRQTVGTRWDLIVDLRASPMAFLLRARRRRTMFKAGEGNRVESLARWYGLAHIPAPRIWSTRAHAEEALRLVPLGSPVLGINPTANWRGKMWPAESFVELAHRLTAPGGPLPGARIAVMGGPGEEALAAPVIEAFPAERIVDLVGIRDLVVAAETMLRCDLVVSNDSGLMHLSAAAGARTLGLFGPSRVEHYAPWGAHTASVTTRIPHDDLFPPDYDTKTTGSLMTSLHVDDAEEAALKLLEPA